MSEEKKIVIKKALFLNSKSKKFYAVDDAYDPNAEDKKKRDSQGRVESTFVTVFMPKDFDQSKVNFKISKSGIPYILAKCEPSKYTPKGTDKEIKVYRFIEVVEG